MKLKTIFVFALAVVVMLCAGCSNQEQTDRTKELIVGIWDFIPEEDYYRYQYSFSPDGAITQYAWGYDEEGKETDISLGNTFGLHYEVIDSDTVAISGSFSGISNEAEEVSVSFPDENTMILGDTTYHRAES